MKSRILFIFGSLVILVCAVLCGCATNRMFSEIQNSAFLQFPEVDQKSKLNDLPFDHSWEIKDLSLANYTKIIVAPVNLDFFKYDDWEQSINPIITSQSSYTQEVKNLAIFITNKAQELFKQTNDKNKLILATEPGPDTLLMEIALIDVVFGKPVANAGALLVPVPGASQALSILTEPSIDFEVRLRDSHTSKILATVADRGYTTRRLINFNKFTSGSATREIAENFLEIICESLNKNKLQKIRKIWFKFLPW